MLAEGALQGLQAGAQPRCNAGGESDGRALSLVLYIGSAHSTLSAMPILCFSDAYRVLLSRLARACASRTWRAHE